MALPFKIRNVRRRKLYFKKAKVNEKNQREAKRSPTDMTDGDIDLSCLEDSTAGEAVKGSVGLNSKALLMQKGQSKGPEITEISSTACKFNVNSYKCVFVDHNESVLYNHFSLFRAKMFHKKVSERLNDNFHSWHKKWLKDNVPEDEARKCQNWLLGKTDDSKPTMCVEVDDPTKPPYYCYHRYRVQEKT